VRPGLTVSLTEVATDDQWRPRRRLL